MIEDQIFEIHPAKVTDDEIKKAKLYSHFKENSPFPSFLRIKVIREILTVFWNLRHQKLTERQTTTIVRKGIDDFLKLTMTRAVLKVLWDIQHHVGEEKPTATSREETIRLLSYMRCLEDFPQAEWHPAKPGNQYSDAELKKTPLYQKIHEECKIGELKTESGIKKVRIPDDVLFEELAEIARETITEMYEMQQENPSLDAGNSQPNSN